MRSEMIGGVGEDRNKIELIQMIVAMVAVIASAIVADIFFPALEKIIYYVYAVIAGLMAAPLIWGIDGLWKEIKGKKIKKI